MLEYEPDKQFLDAMATLSVAQASKFTPQDISASLWGFSGLRHDPGEEYFDKIGVQGTNIIASFYSVALSKTLLAAAKMGFPDGPFLEALVLEVGRKLGYFGLHSLFKVLWSLCILQKCTVEMWGHILARLGELEVLAEPGAEISVESLQQVYQVGREQIHPRLKYVVAALRPTNQGTTTAPVQFLWSARHSGRQQHFLSCGQGCCHINITGFRILCMLSCLQA